MAINISDKAKEEIRNSLPRLNSKWLTATQFGFGVVHNDIDQDTNIHVSLVCLYDAHRRAELALDSVFQSRINIIWYRQEWQRDGLQDQEREFFAVRQGKYYADYNMLILYAIGEDIAEFILTFLSEEANFSSWQNTNKIKLESKRITSKAARVGCFMEEKHKQHPITDSILRLKDNRFWNTAMRYRNTWVHDKPPIMDGTGVEHERKSRIETGTGYKGMRLGGGADPKYKIDDLVSIAQEATVVCVSTLSDLVEILVAKRIELGEEINFENGEISFQM